ncbi:MAG: DUF2029 domain-containing protein [Acidobacteria bacterium]|nr:DUF2029 domain-containing protein [Acidobacteriota bacterium]
MTAPGLSRLRGALSRPASAADLLAVVLLVFLPLNFLYGAVLTHLHPPDKNDFTSYYVAARVVESGRAGDLYYPEPKGSLLAQASIEHPWIDVARSAGIDNPNYYLYPPLFAVAFVPLAALPYETAFAAWLLLNVAFLAGAFLLCLPPRRDRTLSGLAAAALVALTFYPVWHHLKIGQSSLLVLLLLAACLALLRRGREGAAGLALSGAILLKLTPVIFIPFLWMRGRRRAAVAATLAVAALTAISLAVTGPAAQITYVTRMIPLLSAGTAFYPNQSLNGFVTRLLGAGDLMKADLSTGLGAARAASGAAAAALVGLSFLAIFRRRGETGMRADDDGFALLTVASLLASPISWEHHYVCLLLPAFILIGRWAGGETPRRGLAAFAGAALALAGSYVGLAVFEKFGVGPLHPLLSSAAFVGAGMLWIVFASGATRPAPPAASEATGPGRPSVVALLTLMAVFAGGQFLLKLAEYDTSFSYGDFTSYYVAASAVAEGRPEALYVPGTPDPILAKAETPSAWTEVASSRGVKDANYYLYPPFFALLVTPLAWLPYGAAHDLWYLVNLGALAGALGWYLWRERSRLGAAERAGVILLTALLWPALFTFGAGQANFIVLLMILGGLFAAESGRAAPAGLALAAAVAIKLTPALLVLWFAWKRRWDVVGWTAGFGAAIVGVSAAVVGWTSHVVYVREMVPLLARGCAHWVNQSLAALLSRAAGGDPFSWDLAPRSAFVRASGLVLSAIVVASLAAIARRDAGSGRSRLEFGLVLVSTLFLSPISWIHHAVLSLPAIFFLIRAWAAAGRATLGRAGLLALAFALLAIYVKPPGLVASPWLSPLASYHLAGQVILWSLLAAEIVHLRRPAPREMAA